MDWKIDQQRREKIKAGGSKKLSPSVNVMGELERDFAQIFGGNGNSGYGFSRRQAGDPVRRGESFGQFKDAKAE